MTEYTQAKGFIPLVDKIFDWSISEKEDNLNNYGEGEEIDEQYYKFFGINEDDIDTEDFDSFFSEVDKFRANIVREIQSVASIVDVNRLLDKALLPDQTFNELMGDVDILSKSEWSQLKSTGRS